MYEIYSAHDMGLFYAMLLPKTLEMKGQSCHSGKHSKRHVTTLLCTNAHGSDKCPPLVNGKCAVPHFFKGNGAFP